MNLPDCTRCGCRVDRCMCCVTVQALPIEGLGGSPSAPPKMEPELSDSDIRFRDNCAIQILQAYINKDKDHSSITGDFLDRYDHEEAFHREYAYKSMERLIRASYKIADMMRKARLAVFE